MTLTDLRTDTELERQIAADWLCDYGTEADWNRLLDQHHSDQQLRRRFGEWLLEQGEAKGEGYLALSACGRTCSEEKSAVGFICPFWAKRRGKKDEYKGGLPSEWFENLSLKGKGVDYAPSWGLRINATREELEEAAAAAFLLLPEDRREQLLRGEL